jgi:hypothetical protein
MTSLVYKAPQIILDELGIVEPEDIDVEAIGQFVGATVVYEPLQGCEARIVGNGHRAIITVDQNAPRARQRFSVGHELGHWMNDRGTVAFACSDETVSSPWDELLDPEARANRYAANLLLPAKIFRPKAAGRPMVFDSVRALATVFATSMTATAIRFVEHGPFPSMIVCTEKGKRKWFFRGPDVPESVWPVDSPGNNTVAYDLLNGKATSSPEDVYADQWLSRTERNAYRLREDSIRGPLGQILTLLWWVDEAPLGALADEEEGRAARRSDWRKD